MKIKKDYAKRRWIKEPQDWQYVNKESCMDLAKLGAFIVVAAACGFIFVTGLVS